MGRVFLLLTFPAFLGAADWLEFRSGPFVVLSNGAEKEGREALNYLEQLRHALGSQLGQPDLPSVWPVKILLGKRGQPATALQFGRDAWICSVGDLQPATAASIAKVLLDSSPGAVPPSIERGLVQLYSTLQVDGTRVTLGAVPAQKDRDWSRVHMLSVQPEFSGKLRVLLFNLGKGVEQDVAYRNAFEKTAEQVESSLNRYIEAGNYGTYPVSGRPLNPRRELLPKKIDASVAALASADLQLASGSASAAAAYEALSKQTQELTEAQEGLGLLAAKTSQPERARTLLANAKSARALLELAKLLPDAGSKRAALAKAAVANRLWAEPHRLLAELEPDLARKAAELKLAAQLEPRNSGLWVALAQSQEGLKQFADAGRSWTAAERSTDDNAQRQQIRQARADMTQRRVEQQIADREELRRKAEQEIQDLKNKALTEIRAAEARANAGKPVIDASKLPEYKEEQSKAISGALQRVECRGQEARLHVFSGGKIYRLSVADPNKVVIRGGGEKALSCGPQKPARPVTVEYTPAMSPGVAGEVATVEFR